MQLINGPYLAHLHNLGCFLRGFHPHTLAHLLDAKEKIIRSSSINFLSPAKRDIIGCLTMMRSDNKITEKKTNCNLIETARG
jgi:hypothetical protein